MEGGEVAQAYRMGEVMEVVGRYEKSLGNWLIILNLSLRTLCISFLSLGPSPNSQNPLERPRE